MADDADISKELEELHLQQSLEKQARSTLNKLTPLKECYFCGEPFSKSDPARKSKLFCNGDHATKYEEQNNRGRR